MWLCHFLIFLAAVARVQAITLRGRVNHHHEQAESQELSGFVPAVMMPRGVMACPAGQQILSQRDCDAAFNTIIAKYAYDAERAEALPVSWPHIPKGCSVSKGKAYFNIDASKLTPGDSAVGGSLSFHVVCAPAAYKEFSHEVFCQGDVLYNGGGPTANGSFADLAACREECDQDPRCNFFLWKFQKGTSLVHHCATFKQCRKPEAYTDGESAVVFQKVSAPVSVEPSSHFVDRSSADPRRSFKATRVKPAGKFPKHGALHFRRISRGKDAGGELSVVSAPAPAVAAPVVVPVAWFACQLVGGRERIVWTKERMAVMTRSSREDHCGQRNKLHCMKSRFYTGMWSIEADALRGASVLFKWDYLPPMRVHTENGGLAFHSLDGKNEYSCTAPPPMLTKLIKAGIKESQVKLAEAQRTHAFMPTAYSEHGCLEIEVQPLKANILRSQFMSLSKCFTHCAKTKGLHYFAVTGGDSCFCSPLSPGTPRDEGNCDLRCNGNDEELCGGFAGYANVYTMIDCLPPDAQEKKDDAAFRLTRLRALYSMRKSQSCGRHKNNDVEIEGSRWLVGRPIECEQACLAGKGAAKCHGFTYSELTSRCTFHQDVFWGNATIDPHSSCYFKKSTPLLE